MFFRALGRVFRAVRGPFHRPLEPLLWLASVVSARRVWSGTETLERAAARARMDARLAKMHPARRALPLIAVLAQWKADGARWQVVPAYIGTGLCMTVSAAGSRLPLWVRRCAAFGGGATTAVSVASGILIPVFRMPKPTGPYKVGKRTLEWTDKSRKSWLLKSKGRGSFPEHRKLMANVWYPACEDGLKGLKHVKQANWLEPKLARSLAISFFAPGWCVNYFRLVRMEAYEDAPVASGKFPVIMFSHSFSGMKEQNSALLQELASWGYIVVTVDHPHDAALVLYPDGSTADFRGYDMPNDKVPFDWWKFRNTHLRWRALDVLHALDQAIAMNDDEENDFYGRFDVTRVAAIGHSFGGAAVGMLSQMDPRIKCVIMLDPWMWPFGYERMMQGLPCPLLAFEAPRFLGNRDIFCVSNSEMISTLCARTAPAACSKEVEPKRLFDILERVDESSSESELNKEAREASESTEDDKRREGRDAERTSVDGRPPSPGRPPRHPRRSNGADSNDGMQFTKGMGLAASRNSSWGSFMSADEMRDPSGVAFKAVIEQTMHFDFTDLAMVAPFTSRLLGVVAVGGYEIHELSTAACLRFLHAYNHPHNDTHILSAEELDAQARAIYPGPWKGCAFDERVKGDAHDPKRQSTPLKTVRDEMMRMPSTGWEKKGGICRWVPTNEFTLDPERPWTDEQNREVRWLCAETEDKGVQLSDRDLHCMFPTRTPMSTRGAIKAYRECDDVFPEPEKLAWLSQALLDGDASESMPNYDALRP
ncbi:Platelet-activating factor acetylhydrolase [Ostreococcus tauri]|uniref:1-alkyl-2-acetylglycerophosphocholine esterase n=1 Tax=Ostreococcus tauri TaxID=70448 RepID=A0A096P8L1_OSTTA|nr:Platelet-activating factor acetylhydrolase [Ostreococcus tauri]CEG00583.1 Platelet-activating factor acetylhydrolase [Ostreococcus tauri]|eukprot:XP_003083914.2 Platelet-activating factor acetylhydrolase [Ostreococcus tauri]